MFSLACRFKSKPKRAVPGLCQTTIRFLGSNCEGERDLPNPTDVDQVARILYIFYKVVLTIAILPSPSLSPRNEFNDPFSQRMSDENAPNNSQSPLSTQQPSLATLTESILRPALRHGNSSASIQSSSTDE